jgi:SSS family solute:Na+ symporter
VEWFSLDVTNRSTAFAISTGMFFWFICTHGANQVALQRYFSVKNVSAARRSYLVSAVTSFIVALILAGVGISLMYFIKQYDLPAAAMLDSADEKLRNEAQDSIFPQFISIYLPSGLRGMVVAALFAAAMSTIDSGANSVSTILTVDFFRRLNPKGSTVARELRRARMITAGMGVIIIVVSIFLYHLSKGTNIIDLCQKGFNCFLGPLGAMFVLALFSKRATARSVIPAVIIGEVFGICSSYSEKVTGFLAQMLGGQLDLFGYSFQLSSVPYSTHLVIPGSWLVTIVAGLMFNVLLNTRATDEQQQWMWLPVVRSRSLPGE